METLYCQCFCNFLDNMYYTSCLICTVNKFIIIDKSKRFKAINDYEALIVLVNRIILKLEVEYKEYLIDKRVVFIINNKALINDLTSKNKRTNLEPSLNDLYIKIYDTVKFVEIAIIENLDEQLLNNTIMGNYIKFYTLVHQLYLIIKKYQKINEECYKRLSNNDMAIQDILHLIEFSVLTANKKTDYIDAIKKIRGDRREIKNELSFLNYFAHSFNKISNDLNRLLNLQTSKNGYEISKYKQIFSTKEARDKLLKTL